MVDNKQKQILEVLSFDIKPGLQLRLPKLRLLKWQKKHQKFKMTC